MRLTAKQILAIATGVLDSREEHGRLHLMRTTHAQRSIYTPEDSGWRRAPSNAGITLDFFTDSQQLTLACSGMVLNPAYHCTFDILVNGELHASFTLSAANPEWETPLESGFRHIFPLPEGEKRVTLYFPLYAMAIDAVELEEGASLRPYVHSRTWVAFGDSITEGREPEHPSNSYVCRLARMLDAHVYNQGISGEMFRSRKLIPGTYPACDFVTVAYGTNDFRKQAPELLIPEASAFFRQVTEEFPTVPIFYFLPLWRKDCHRVTRERTLEEVRALLRQEAEGYSRITVIDCWDFIPHEEQYFFDQRLHPNDAGFAFYADALYRELTKYLP